MVSSVPDLLAGWELGLSADQSRRAVLLHSLARPGEPADGLLGVSVGERDADLVRLRRRLFGDAVPLRCACAACGEELEFTFDLAVIPVRAVPAGEQRVASGDWTVLVRPPTTGDLLAVGAAPPQQARRVLLAACVVEAAQGGRPADAGDLPADVCRRVAEACAAADPQADITLTTTCVACGQQTAAALDIGAVLWAELDHWARSLLLDVHLLARTYGWTEAEVFALSPLRRRYYLELAGHD
ncbi:T4 family baseplate hub assembly chaperone [Mangrovihabitans endophyticus]|uniref:Phage baseplate protein n=1 Tax=Mangrovihabitans endophyticus TaxID=1751298 RepID=A0A8J3BSU3_9ACTN|nr:hypothetical protein [Mangrovihabitans endophyticus]GGK74484.1 hypothetical protein GCM10012284_05540 [Mangrovihabitans endophyticus]